MNVATDHVWALAVVLLLGSIAATCLRRPANPAAASLAEAIAVFAFAIGMIFALVFAWRVAT